MVWVGMTRGRFAGGRNVKAPLSAGAKLRGGDEEGKEKREKWERKRKKVRKWKAKSKFKWGEEGRRALFTMREGEKYHLPNKKYRSLYFRSKVFVSMIFTQGKGNRVTVSTSTVKTQNITINCALP